MDNEKALSLPELTKQAKEIIQKIIYITIATVSPEGWPWNTPVYSAYDDKYNFYWASAKDSLHSRHIAHNPQVAISIYDSTVPEGTGRGVYIKAKVYELNSKDETEQAAKLLYARKNKESRKAEEFLGDFPRRIYKAAPEIIWTNTKDRRVEVDLS